MTQSDLTKSEMAQQIYYDRISDAYDEHHFNEHALRYRYDHYDAILEGFDLRNKIVLDAMCGGGQAAGYFIGKQALVTGIDISKRQCDQFRARYPEANVVQGSILNTAFCDSSFDLIVTDSLHHLHPHLDKGVMEILRLLKPGGCFLFWEPTAKSFVDLFRKVWYKLDKTYFEESEKSIDLDDILTRYGDDLDLVRVKYGGNVAYLFVQESLLFRIPPGMVKYYVSFLNVIEKFLTIFQTRFTSCWVLALVRKS